MKNIIPPQEQVNACVVNEIKEKESYYLIYVKKNDSIFKIISEKDSFASDCKKIKIKGMYDLNLIKTFPLDSILGLPIAYNLGVRGIEMPDKTIVEFEKKSHYTLYHARNLKGLCIINQ